MKKLYILLAVLAVFAVSCNKDNDNNKNKNNNQEQNQNGNENGNEDENAYKAPITIDGEFADWAALDASKMCVATCAENALQKGVKVLKVYMDDLYMFVYFEYDDAAIPDKSDVQGHVYFDADNNEETGGCSNQWTPGSIEYMGEGHFFRGDVIESFNPSLSYWTGELHAQGWEWENVLASGSGLFTGAGKDGKYEMSMLLEMFPAEPTPLAEEFGFGLDIQQDWSSVGIIPNESSTDENPNGKSKLLTVKKAQ